MTHSKKSRKVMATRYIDCPHCKKPIILTGIRPVNISDSVLHFLRAAPMAIKTIEIVKKFPSYSPRSIRNALMFLKQEGAVTNAPYGYWSAEDDVNDISISS